MMNVSSLLLFTALLLPATGTASAQAEASANVILVTFDGVRFRDIFAPETRFGEWARQNGGHAFGTQEPGDRMLVGNNTGLSLPGYKALISGVYESACRNNRCGPAQNETLIDRLTQLWSPREVALFSSWNHVINAAEKDGVSLAVQSLGFHGLRNFEAFDEHDREFIERADATITESRRLENLPPWSGGRRKPYKWARWDRYTWDLATDYIQSYHPRFIWISLLDTDELAHDRRRQDYHEKIRWYDDKLMQLLQQLQAPEHAEYFKNTSIVLTTDHGRGPKKRNFKKHGPNFFGSIVPESTAIWTYVIPSQKMLGICDIQRSAHGQNSAYSQLDIRPTIEFLLDLPPEDHDRDGTSLLTSCKNN